MISKILLSAIVGLSLSVSSAAAAPPQVNTIIDSGPPTSTTETNATFTFHGTRGATSFRCSLDNSSFTACTSPKVYSGLSVSSHRFQVFAIDKKGNQDSTPSSWVWSVTDPTPPPTTQCSDGVDNADPEDTLVDLADPGCVNAADNDETDPVTPPPSDLTLTPVDGGLSYYGQFTNPLSNSVFPIGVWFARPDTSNALKYKDTGINMYIGVECPECGGSTVARNNGIRTFIQANERTRFSDLGSEQAGWLLADEVDMSSGPGNPSTGTGAGYDVMRNSANSVPADGKAKYANYGKGVYMWETDAQAAYFVNHFQDLQSDDMYWMTDPNERSRPEYGKPSSYGTTVDRMRFLDGMDGQRKPIWNFVETGWAWSESAANGGRAILPAELRAAIWHSIIAGARGIIYFDHNFGGPCQDRTLGGSCYPANTVAVKETDAQVQSLTSVLNSPTVTSGTTTSSGIRSMIKWDGSNFYVFAGSRGSASTGQVSIPCVGNATATVLGESRSVQVASGSFQDAFADGNAVHIYRIDGGSRCGL